MADETTQNTSQADDTAQAATDTQTSTEPAATARTPEDLEAEIRKLRAEAAGYRTKAKEGETAKAELEKLRQAEMTEQEKRDARIKELEAQNAEAITKVKQSTVRAMASELGFADPKDAAKLLDSIPDDEKELEDALKGLLKTKPYLAKSAGSGIPDTGKGGNPETSTANASKAKEAEIISRNSFLAKKLGAQKV